MLRPSTGPITCGACCYTLDRAEFYDKGVWCKMCHGLRHYHMTRRDYDRMLAEQGGRCKICRTDNPNGRSGGGKQNERFCVDHDHACCPRKGYSCGECVRGLLCSDCNLLIGYASDDVKVLAAAIAYLAGGE